jgi:hypothetical protein
VTKRVLSHIPYLLFFLLGAYLAFRGVEDFALLLFGNITDAKILRVSTESVRVGKRGRGIKYQAKYEFVAEDGKTYGGFGEPDGQSRPERGYTMPVRYLSFSPSVNAPRDDVVGTGVFLTLIGVFLSLIVLGAWRKKISAVQAAAAPGERTAGPGASPRPGRKEPNKRRRW